MIHQTCDTDMYWRQDILQLNNELYCPEWHQCTETVNYTANLIQPHFQKKLACCIETKCDDVKPHIYFIKIAQRQLIKYWNREQRTGKVEKCSTKTPGGTIQLFKVTWQQVSNMIGHKRASQRGLKMGGIHHRGDVTSILKHQIQNGHIIPQKQTFLLFNI